MGSTAPASKPVVEGDEQIRSDKQQTMTSNILEQTGLAKKKEDIHSATSKFFYIKHVGFNDIEISEGKDGKGELAYYVDVKAKFAGWDVTLRRADGTSLLHLRKDVTLARLLGWDKGTAVEVSDLKKTLSKTPPSEVDSQSEAPSTETTSSTGKLKQRLKLQSSAIKRIFSRREKVQGEPTADDVVIPDIDDSLLAELDDREVSELPSRKVCTITREHAFRSNQNVFTFDGKQYAWNYWIFLGSTLKLVDLELDEELAVVQLLPTWRFQIITSWSWRLNGTLEIKEEATRRGMEDIIVATLTAMLEWRKHNNKVWIIAAAIA